MSKYENFTLKDLSMEYFVMEQRIQKLIEKKNDVCKEIDDQYEIKREVYNMIKIKQNEKIELNRD